MLLLRKWCPLLDTVVGVCYRAMHWEFNTKTETRRERERGRDGPLGLVVVTALASRYSTLTCFRSS